MRDIDEIVQAMSGKIREDQLKRFIEEMGRLEEQEADGDAPNISVKDTMSEISETSPDLLLPEEEMEEESEENDTSEGMSDDDIDEMFKKSFKFQDFKKPEEGLYASMMPERVSDEAVKKVAHRAKKFKK